MSLIGVGGTSFQPEEESCDESQTGSRKTDVQKRDFRYLLAWAVKYLLNVFPVNDISSILSQRENFWNVFLIFFWQSYFYISFIFGCKIHTDIKTLFFKIDKANRAADILEAFHRLGFSLG